MFICRTRTCIQPSHYFVASTSGEGSSDVGNTTCYYGAKRCPSMVAKAKKQQTSCSHAHDSSAHNHAESEKEDSPSVEDAQLLRTERQGCCKKKQEPPPEKKCCKKMQESVVVVHDSPCCKEESTERDSKQREDSPQISCCHSAKSTPTESQEQIM